MNTTIREPELLLVLLGMYTILPVLPEIVYESFFIKHYF